MLPIASINSWIQLFSVSFFSNKNDSMNFFRSSWNNIIRLLKIYFFNLEFGPRTWIFWRQFEWVAVRNQFSNVVSSIFLRTHFITLGKILQEEKVEISKTAFQLQAEEKISLKDYYETRAEYSLFEWKSFRMKWSTKPFGKLLSLKS